MQLYTAEFSGRIIASNQAEDKASNLASRERA